MKKIDFKSKKVLLIGAIVVLVIAIGFVGVRLLSLSGQQEAPIPTQPPQPPVIVVAPTTYQLEVNLQGQVEKTVQEETIPENQMQATAVPTPTTALLAEQTLSPTAASAFIQSSPTATSVTTSPVQSEEVTQTTTPESGSFYTAAFAIVAVALIVFAFIF